MNLHCKIFKYDKEKCPFEKRVSRILNCHDLSLLHEQLNEKTYEVFDRNNDDKTIFHKKFYSSIDSNFLSLYRNFIKGYIKDLIGEEFLYQKIPALRVHLPDNLAVGEFHRDADYNHPIGEINFIIPLTEMCDSNTIWIESSPGKADYKPFNLQVGEFLSFNGCECVHGNKLNETKKTRVSFDFRIMPLSKYKGAGNSKWAAKKFTKGEYYDEYCD